MRKMSVKKHNVSKTPSRYSQERKEKVTMTVIMLAVNYEMLEM